MTYFEKSFVEDMRESSMLDMISNTNMGPVIDELVESEMEKVHLFESEDDKQWKKAISGAQDEIDSEHSSLLDDGDMIDELI